MTRRIGKKQFSLLSALLQRASFYRTSKSYIELLEFVSLMPNIAPFNLMLLHIQKPGLCFAATAADWRDRFDRTVKDGARPLVILWPFSPVAFVYDVVDTDGGELPHSVAHAFRAVGGITHATMQGFDRRLRKKGIHLSFLVYGDGFAAKISAQGLTVESLSRDRKIRPSYRISINPSHDPNVQFGTLAHELAHLYLGHFGEDRYLSIWDRSLLEKGTKEVEAESVAYLVCRRANVKFES